ncbi:hypothetical protein LNV09_08170 [Paucibacter sp. B2R-40]|nr:hypothetical protein [Paucibacter sp. B2R-40]MCV2354141.1 hypothetical protein [Paucibacter sp. B2R-40]
MIKIKLEPLGETNNAAVLEIHQADDLGSHFPPKIRSPAVKAANQLKRAK